MIRYVLSRRQVRSQAALQGKTIADICRESGLGGMYISRLWGKDNFQLSTLNRIAEVLECNPLELLEMVGKEEE